MAKPFVTAPDSGDYKRHLISKNDGEHKEEKRPSASTRYGKSVKRKGEVVLRRRKESPLIFLLIKMGHS